MYADLHVHSAYSDGTDSIEELVKRAADRGVKAMALSDHDTVEGVGEFMRLCGHNGITGVPCVEISTSARRRRVHILGYFPDCGDRGLLDFLARLSAARTANTKEILQKLGELGILEYSWKSVLRHNAGCNWIHSSHVFRAMMKDGIYGSWEEWAGFFHRYFGKDSAAYIDINIFTANDAIDVIRGAGGLPVLAHPGLIGDDGLIGPLIERGLAGIEVHYPAHGPDDVERYLSMCRRHGLAVTGGTDWHGKLTEWDVRPGDFGIDEEHFADLLGRKR